MGPHSFQPEKYGMVFCSQCHGSGKNKNDKEPCLRCGGFGLLIRDGYSCSTVLWGDSALLSWEEYSPEVGRDEGRQCTSCEKDCDYELVKCLPGRKYQVKCRACGRVFVIDRPKSQIHAVAPRC